MKDKILLRVKDIDPYMERYEVRDRGHVLGEKAGSVYRKPRRTRGGWRAPPGNRNYKVTPPWMGYEVVGITGGGSITISVKMPEK